ncbi:alpha-amylase family glycosyl hydrolase, partial [Clostridioides difficile]
MLDFKKSIVYQIYLKSFNDTTNNGLGDLNGITEKLDYLEFLGVDYVWITPFFVSPQNDNGYDVADYYNIDPIYGTMDDLENLIKEAKKRNIGIMLD